VDEDGEASVHRRESAGVDLDHLVHAQAREQVVVHGLQLAEAAPPRFASAEPNDQLRSVCIGHLSGFWPSPGFRFSHRQILMPKFRYQLRNLGCFMCRRMSPPQLAPFTRCRHFQT